MSRPATTSAEPIVEAPKQLTQRIQVELFWVIGSNIAITLINAMIGLLIARHYPVVEYGRLAYFVNLFGGLRLLGALGLTSQVVIDLSRCRGRNEAAEPRFYKLFWLRLASISAITILTAGFGWIIADPVLVVAALAAAVALIVDFGIGALQGLGLVIPAVAALCVQPLTYTAVALGVVQYGLPVDGIYAAFLISFSIALLIVLIQLAYKLGQPIWAKLTLVDLKAVLSTAGGMYALSILSTMFTSCVTISLGWDARFADLALIAVPLYLVLTPSVVVGAATSNFYFPQIVAIYSRKAPDEAQALFNIYYRLVSAGTVLVAVALLFFPHTLLELLYAGRYDHSAELLLFIAPTTFLYAAQTVLSFTIVAQGRVRDALLGALVPLLILILALIIGFLLQAPLLWFAAAFLIATLVGFIWHAVALQLRLAELLRQTLIQAAVAIFLIGSAFLLTSDSAKQLLPTLVALTCATMLYLAWIWRVLFGGKQ